MGISNLPSLHWPRRQVVAGVFGACLSFLVAPSAFGAWGSFADVWVQGEGTNGLCGSWAYPCSSQLTEPVNGQVQLAVNFDPVEYPTVGGSFDFYFGKDTIDACKSYYPGSVPALTSAYVNNALGEQVTLNVYEVNSSLWYQWTAWENPYEFKHLTFAWSPGTLPTSAPTGTNIGVVCATQNGDNIWTQATPPGSTSWRSYTYEDVDAYSYPNWSDQILIELINATTTSAVTSTGNGVFDRLVGEVAQFQYKWPWGYLYRMSDALAYGYVSAQEPEDLTLVFDSSILGGNTTTTIFSSSVLEDKGFEPDMFRSYSTYLFMALGLFYIFDRVVREVESLKI